MKELFFCCITFTGDYAWGEIKPIRPTIGLGGTIYSEAFFPNEKFRYEAYIYYSIIAKAKIYEYRTS